MMRTPETDDLLFWQKIYRRNMAEWECLDSMYRASKNKDSLRADALWSGAYAMKIKAEEAFRFAVDEGKLLFMWIEGGKGK